MAMKRFLLAFLAALALAASPAWALSPAQRAALFSGKVAPVYVGNKSATSCTFSNVITSCAYTFGSAVGAGHSVAIIFILPNSSDTGHYVISSVTDNASGATNSYTIQTQPQGWGGATFGVDLAFVTGIKLYGSPSVITLNFTLQENLCSGAGCNQSALLDEFSGASSVNSVVSCSEMDITTPSVKITTTVPNAVVDALGALSNGPTAAPPGWFSGIQDVNSGVSSAYRTAFVPSSYTASWSEPAALNNVCGVAFAP